MSTGPQNMSYPALYRACMKEAAAQGRTLMQRLVVRAGGTMPRRAAMAPDEHERKLLFDAVRTLMKHEHALCEAYPQALLAEFAQAIAGDTRKSGSLRFEALELMGDDQMQESVELMRLQQSVLARVEAELAELNALVCAVQGLASVRPDRNPLRPEVYVRSLRTVTLQSPVPTAVRSRWMQHLGEALGEELARVYSELSQMLRSQGVAEARFNAVAASDGAPSAQLSSAESPAAAQASTLLNVRELRRLLSGEFNAAGPAAGDPVAGAAERPEFSVTVPAAFEVLQEMKQVDRVMDRLKQRQEGGQAPQPRRAGGVSALHAQLRGQASGPGQALGLEVVTLMVENIATDARLLPPVQQTVRDLEPALLRLGLQDPRFFSDRRHPARRLLDQMTQRSLAWDSVDAPGFAGFLEPLQQAVDVLLSTAVPGPEPFQFALQSLEEAWGEQQQRDRHYREKAVRALLQAEQRNLLAGKIAKDMRGLAEEAGAPRDIAAFLIGPWSQVMAQARLGDATGVTDPGGYAGIINDLLWSAQPRLAGGNTAKLMKLIPVLVEKLRHGLATIDYPGPSVKRFLDGLAERHREAMKLRGTAGLHEGQQQRPAPPATAMTRDELDAMLDDDAQESGPWLGPTEAQHSGFMETHHSVVPKPLFQQTQPGFGETAAPESELAAGLTESQLQPGTWVDMQMDGGGWARFQVSWASPHGTLFMFAGAGGKPHSMTRRLVGEMRQSGTLRLVSDQALVDGALDAVAQAALRNSAG